ncbi:hypothetical protein E2C01_055066 [Portunus trituberculatus]|uniref:Uncharacterized protein n=1 Tax=Portunus trituberculatus TaxID=210409 RepID=A0A5B7GWL9_PORTR|nr:hypothetical protein [Portunus trituberculatus]
MHERAANLSGNIPKHDSYLKDFVHISSATQQRDWLSIHSLNCLSISSIIGSLFLVSIFAINVEAVSPALLTPIDCLMTVETVEWGNSRVLGLGFMLVWPCLHIYTYPIFP